MKLTQVDENYFEKYVYFKAIRDENGVLGLIPIPAPPECPNCKKIRKLLDRYVGIVVANIPGDSEQADTHRYKIMQEVNSVMGVKK